MYGSFWRQLSTPLMGVRLSLKICTYWQTKPTRHVQDELGRNSANIDQLKYNTSQFETETETECFDCSSVQSTNLKPTEAACSTNHDWSQATPRQIHLSRCRETWEWRFGCVRGHLQVSDIPAKIHVCDTIPLQGGHASCQFHKRRGETACGRVQRDQGQLAAQHGIWLLSQ